MTPATVERLFGWRHAFDHPVTVVIAAGLLTLLAVTPLVIAGLARAGVVGADQRRELWRRYLSWLVLVPLMAGPVLLGAAWFMAAVAALSLACYREYARATGLFREKAVSLLVVFGILAVTFAVVDNWYYLFVALFPLAAGAIAALPILTDRPQGYVQRVALGVFGFTLFGSALGHLGYIANDPGYRPVVLLVLVAVELNDVFAYVCGKSFWRRKLAPNTSPNKT